MFDKICEYFVYDAIEMMNVEATENEIMNKERLSKLLEKNEKENELTDEIAVSEELAVNKGFKIGMKYAILLAADILKDVKSIG